MPKTVGKYQIGKTLGEGTFGKVKFAVNSETGEAVAIKVLDKERIQKQSMGQQIKKEISIMKMVKHDWVVQVRARASGPAAFPTTLTRLSPAPRHSSKRCWRRARRSSSCSS